MCRMRAIPMAPISIARACEAKWKSRKQKITCNGQFSTPLSCLSTVDGIFFKGLLNIIKIGSADLSPVTMAREYPYSGAGNGSQADLKRNNNAIQMRKLSQYMARNAEKSKQINF